MKEKEFPVLLENLTKLNALYKQMENEKRTDENADLKSSIDDANRRWNSLNESATLAGRDLDEAIDRREKFISHLQSVNAHLSDLDEQVSAVEQSADRQQALMVSILD